MCDLTDATAAATAEVQAAMSQLPPEAELSWLGLNKRLGLSDGAALFSQIEVVSVTCCPGTLGGGGGQCTGGCSGGWL